MKRRKTWLKNMQADTSSAFSFSSQSGLIMSSEPQATAAPQAEPPGRMRRLWQALGRNRAGRLLRLAIIAVTGWVAVEAASGVSRIGYRQLVIGDTGSAVLHAIDYALGLRVQTDRNIAAIPLAPVYPLPPACLTDVKYAGKSRFYDQVDACFEEISHPDPIFGERCQFEVPWQSACLFRKFHMHVFEHPETFARLISAIKYPCRYLPSPEKIAAARDTSVSTAELLQTAWQAGGCDGEKPIPVYWTEIEFLDRSAAPDSPKRSIIVMIPTGK
ncbi:hypothetical protein [Ferrovibrio sp.]|uniref:hypothetical protein n=1 Tax=Ferrovibrio sp. TaxID=1917215 RepID=UPI0035B30F72